MKTLACISAPGSGGQGRHFAELIGVHRERGELARYYTTAIDQDDGLAEVIGIPVARVRGRFTLARFDGGARTYLECEAFDRAVAARLTRTNSHIAFAAQGLHTFGRARRAGVDCLELVSPTAHVDLAAKRYEAAFERYPYERSWLNDSIRRKTLAEYSLADVIHVSTEYIRTSFLDAGIASEKLALHPLTVDQRFKPSDVAGAERPFSLVYVGAISVAKGVPVLLEAFGQLADPEATLTLVGGYGSRGMRKLVERSIEADRRVRLALGDPMSHLARADVCVHPSFQDGFGYAPMEALACGVPVVVSEDTGMKEHIRDGVNGFVVPTGDTDALLERLVRLRDHPLRPGPVAA